MVLLQQTGYLQRESGCRQEAERVESGRAGSPSVIDFGIATKTKGSRFESGSRQPWCSSVR